MKFTKEDVERFKQMVEDCKKESLVRAQELVDAGLAKWKPEFDPQRKP